MIIQARTFSWNKLIAQWTKKLQHSYETFSCKHTCLLLSISKEVEGGKIINNSGNEHVRVLLRANETIGAHTQTHSHIHQHHYYHIDFDINKNNNDNNADDNNDMDNYNNNDNKKNNENSNNTKYDNNDNNYNQETRPNTYIKTKTKTNILTTRKKNPSPLNLLITQTHQDTSRRHRRLHKNINRGGVGGRRGRGRIVRACTYPVFVYVQRS